MTQIKSNFGTINSIFEELFGNQNLPNWNKPSGFSPLVNVGEQDNHYFIEIVAPGLQKSDFSVNIEKDMLTVSYDKSETQENETKKYHRKDFSHVSFKRTFHVEKNVDFDKIEAKYESGVLELLLPKKEEEQPTAKTVEIK